MKIVPAPDWDAAHNPDALLNVVWPRRHAYHNSDLIGEGRPEPSAQLLRRLRLYGVACARMVWSLLPTDARNAVLLSERYADDANVYPVLQASAVRMLYGPVTFQQHATCAAGWAAAGQFAPTVGPFDPSQRLLWNPAEAAREAAKSLATRVAGPAPAGGSPVSKEWQGAWNRAFSAARAHQAELVRDIFPPPGYVPRLDPEWRTSTVVALAQQMEGAGDFSAVPILADALQDTGCADEVMLVRCRAPSGIHSRGNWVVDLVLGRA